MGAGDNPKFFYLLDADKDGKVFEVVLVGSLGPLVLDVRKPFYFWRDLGQSLKLGYCTYSCGNRR